MGYFIHREKLNFDQALSSGYLIKRKSGYYFLENPGTSRANSHKVRIYCFKHYIAIFLFKNIEKKI